MKRTVAACAWIAVAACNSSSGSPVPPATALATAVAGGCGATQAYKGGEPAWLTRAGANNNPTGLPYVIADPSIAAGFLFGYPPRSGTPSNPSNKILWVVGRPRQGNDLTISVSPVNGNSSAIHMAVPANSGPGEIYPSEVDVPAPGCWRLDLAWGQNQASVELDYA